MNCKGCGKKIDPKFKECPYCRRKITWSERHSEMSLRRTLAKGRRKKLYGDTELAGKRKTEDYPEYMGRGSRNKSGSMTDQLPVIAAGIILLVIIISAGISHGSRKAVEESNEIATATSAATDEAASITDAEAASITDATEGDAVNYPTGGTSMSQLKAEEVIGEEVQENQDEQEEGAEEEISDSRTVDYYQGMVIYSVVSDIMQNGEESYKTFLNDNKNKTFIISEEMLEDDPTGTLNSIWRNLGSAAPLPQYTDNGSQNYSFYIDDQSQLHICITTEENDSAFEIYPDTSEDYKLP